MNQNEPSRTALIAATHRAAHQVLERGLVYRDPLAVPIVGRTSEDVATEAAAHPERRTMRLFIASRHRVAEDAVSQEVDAGVRQVVVLGAGLDTQAYRSTYAGDVSFFEVDHPATGAWKQARLGEARIAVPPTLRFVALDFEREELSERLVQSGFDANAGSIFVWLGVVPYLTEAAISKTLACIASLQGAVVFDYAEPPDRWPPMLRPMLENRAAQVAAIGEAWISYFTPADLADRLHGLGFMTITQHRPVEIVRRCIPTAELPVHSGAGYIVVAATARCGMRA